MRGHGAHEPAYFYWNLALNEGGVSRWGWAQKVTSCPCA